VETSLRESERVDGGMLTQYLSSTTKNKLCGSSVSLHIGNKRPT